MLARVLRTVALAVSLFSIAGASSAAAKCDTVANAVALQQTRDAMDEACPCAAAATAGAHVKCGKAVVNDRVATSQLDKSCKGEALNHAKKSICGRPGAAVCCRVKPSTGKTSHKIVSDPGKCSSTATINACASAFPTVDTGCDATGCIDTVCGNGIVEPDEQCDVPFPDVCDANCQIVTCEPPGGNCGNGTLNAGEACEPAGAASCGWDCQPTPCAAAGVGELDLACVSGVATVGAGSRGTDYLVAWSGLAYRTVGDIIARRLNTDGAPLAASRIASAGVPCSFDESRPAIGGNAGRYVLGWEGGGADLSAPWSNAIFARSYENGDTLGTLDEISRTYPFLMCQTHKTGPMSVAPVPARGANSFAVLWRYFSGCALGGQYISPDGRFYDYPTSTPTTTELTIGSPSPITESVATIASNAGDTLFAWNTSAGTPGSEVVAGSWLASDGSSMDFTVSTRQPAIGGRRPSVAATSDRFLVAWGQGTGANPTEIRAMRVTKLGGPLDADGGLLLGTAAGTITGGPVAAFDGTVWLVVWSETGMSGNDLRAVAVQPDGTIVDASPRLLASGLGTGVSAEPAIASAGDGRSLVLYVKPDGASSAVRGQLVPGT
jgi:hypothetical protein